MARSINYERHSSGDDFVRIVFRFESDGKGSPRVLPRASAINPVHIATVCVTCEDVSLFRPLSLTLSRGNILIN